MPIRPTYDIQKSRNVEGTDEGGAQNFQVHIGIY